MPHEDRDDQRREPFDRNIGTIAALERAALRGRSPADRLSDAISRVTGSTPFAVVHFVFFASWVAVNTGVIPGVRRFDPYPFSFLTLVVSLEAIFLSVFVLMSQNRMTRQADQRAHLDLQVDLLAEQELTTMLRMLHALCVKHRVQVDLPTDRMRQFLEETDVGKLAKTLQDHLPEP